MDVKLWILAVVVVLGVHGVGAYPGSGSPDVKAGHKIDHISRKGTGLVIGWYRWFMNKLDELNDVLDSVQSNVDHVNAEIPGLEAYMNSLMITVTDKLATAEALFNSLNIPPPANDSLVAFFTGAQAMTYDAGSTSPILFPAPDVNTGHWDAATGEFTAPRDGLYWFLMRTGQASNIHLELVRNGVEVLTVSQSSSYYDVKMRTSISFLNAGDVVSVYSGSGSGSRSIGDGIWFSGQLLDSNAKLLPSFL